MTPSSDKPSSQDPLAELDDDLGDDWESAFQAEDFMFSPEDESADFFLPDETDPESSPDTAGPKEEKKATAGAEATSPAPTTETLTAAALEFPGRFQILCASLIQLFQSRSFPQRLLIIGLPIVLLLLIVSTRFFLSTSDELASRDEQTLGDEEQLAAVSQPKDSYEEPLPLKEQSAPPPKAPATVEVETVQEKWQFPTFIIVAKAANKNNLVINIDLTLVAKLEKGQELPVDKQTFVKDIIYQFYANRPAYELKRFSLARGEMISQLKSWINKQWHNNPIDTIIFSHYQVTQTSPPLSPKVTFL